jgi:hypothetical protein
MGHRIYIPAQMALNSRNSALAIEWSSPSQITDEAQHIMGQLLKEVRTVGDVCLLQEKLGSAGRIVGVLNPELNHVHGSFARGFALV